MIKVSVIVPIYKASLEHLRECFDSLVAQTLQESEFIIISDGASDDECSICKEYAKKDARFLFFKREHAGVSTTRNFGIEQAKGEYITFVDSDDWVEKKFLNDVYEYAKKNALDVLSWDYRRIDVPPENQVRALIDYSIELLSEDQKNNFRNNILINQDFGQSLSPCWNRLYRLSFIQNYGIIFCKTLSIGEDKAFNYQVYLYCNRAGYLNKTYYNYRIRNDSVVHKHIPNSLPIYLDYIDYIASFCLPQNQECLGKEFMNVFFRTLNNSYFPANKHFFAKENIIQLKKIILSDKFQKALKLVNVNKSATRFKIYIFCLRNKLLIPIYVRTIRYFFQRSK